MLGRVESSFSGSPVVSLSAACVPVIPSLFVCRVGGAIVELVLGSVEPAFTGSPLSSFLVAFVPVTSSLFVSRAVEGVVDLVLLHFLDSGDGPGNRRQSYVI